MIQKIFPMLLLMIVSSTVFAIDSGRVTVYSMPYETLIAEIDILSVVPKGSGSLVVKMASRSDFIAEGMAYDNILDNLEFSFARHEETGQVYIKVISHEGIQVSSLPFIIEASWGSGRLLRRYNAVIDPDEFLRSIQENNTPSSTGSPDNNIVNVQENATERKPVITPILESPRPVIRKEEKSGGISLITVGPVLLLIIVGVFLLRLRKKKTRDSDFDDDETEDEAFDADANKPEAYRVDENAIPTEVVSRSDVEFSAGQNISAVVEKEQEEDFFSHINELILLGSHDEAERLLEEALDERRDDPEIRERLESICLELLDIYFEEQNEVAFLRQAQKLSHLIDKEESQWLKVVELGQELCPGNSLFESATDSLREIEANEDMLDDASSVIEQDSVMSEKQVTPKPPGMNLENFLNKVQDNRTAAEKVLPKDGVQGKKTEEAYQPDQIPEPEVSLTPSIEEIVEPAPVIELDPAMEQEVETKLELAKAYMEMDDLDSASKILHEVINEGSAFQQREAKALLDEC